jgi:hypothetical protein
MTAYIVGIDPGVSTGFALLGRDGRLARVETLAIDEAMALVLELHGTGSIDHVVFEDARLRTWFGGADARQARSGPGIREGIGSVKRDCSIWSDFLERHGIPFIGIKPSSGQSKWTADYFKRVTGWTGRTSNHARDAAVLIFGRRFKQPAQPTPTKETTTCAPC